MTTTRAKICLQRRVVLGMAAAALACTAAPAAYAAAEPVRLEVIDRETGEAARVWRHAGRLYVAGRPGARYGLRVTNNTSGRLLVVMSVDGINILTGQTAGHGQRGYVFSPYESYDISGWRKSDTEVAAFQFAPLPRSYAARTGRPGDVGVIGIAAFTERASQPLAAAPAPESRASAQDSSGRLSESVATPRAPPPPVVAAPSPAGRAASADTVVTAQRRSERLGTAHGEREWSRVTTVAFERAAARPQFTRQIEYDSYDNLVAAGVIRPAPRPAPRPRPFPANPDRGYVPDPPFGR